MRTKLPTWLKGYGDHLERKKNNKLFTESQIHQKLVNCSHSIQQKLTPCHHEVTDSIENLGKIDFVPIRNDGYGSADLLMKKVEKKNRGRKSHARPSFKC